MGDNSLLANQCLGSTGLPTYSQHLVYLQVRDNNERSSAKGTGLKTSTAICVQAGDDGKVV